MFGISKQAWYKRIQAEKKKEKEQEIVLGEIAKIRKQMPQTGTRKLYAHLKSVLPQYQIKMGRDAMFTLLRNKGLLIRKTKRFHITTNSKHFFYAAPNLLKGLEINHAEQAFVADITYIKTDKCHAYAAIISDAYSRKIMGWSLENNMKVSMVKQALKMAQSNCVHQNKGIIHHSDRGIQYCCPDYAEFAKRNHFVMSNTQKYDPYENAVAERINGILKYEFGLGKTLPDVEIARKMMKQAVEIYNNLRLHWSLHLQTPHQAHLSYNKQKYTSYEKSAV